jgi:NDMA-dependent alcohol dehydrogenase
MRTTAAVMHERNAPLQITEIELDPPGPGEVFIRMVAAGICGSDAHVLEGHFPAPTPSVCGHEGAGVVEAVGSGVNGIAVGDHVLHAFAGSCGVCERCRIGQHTFCTTHSPRNGSYDDKTFRMHALDGSDIATPLGLGSFSRHTVTPARNCIVIPPDVDLIQASLISCGVLTGVGTALNVAKIRPGHSVAVIGVGGVGAAAVVGAVIGGAAALIAIDVTDAKRDAALEFGATDFVNARTEDVGARINEITRGRGVDRVMLTVDQVGAELYQLAIAALAPGGIAVQVGSSQSGVDQLPVDPRAFTLKQLSFTGTVYGGMNPQQDALMLIDLARAGRILLDRFVTRTYELEQINDSFTDLKAGRNIRGVVVF